jgi:subtilisin family serine protease
MNYTNYLNKIIIVISFTILSSVDLYAQLSLKNTSWSGSFKTVAAEKISLQFGDDKLIIKTANNNEVVSVMSFEQRQDRLIISSANGKNSCETGGGSYRILYRHSGQLLSFVPIQDSCRYRNELFADSQTFNFIPDQNSAARDWLQLDASDDSIAGISLDKAYELLKGRKSKPIIVAVIDNGVDIEHEDLKNVIWTNAGEISGNGKDDDHNGYIDDIHGWNFRAAKDGATVENEQFESTRIYSMWKGKYDNADVNRLSQNEKREFDVYTKAKKEYLEKIKEITFPALLKLK